MTARKCLVLGCALTALAACSGKQAGSNDSEGAGSAAAPLKLAGSVDLPGYTGDFDHFAIDTKDGRMFLAGEESAELEVFDLKTGQIIQRVKGYGVPHSVLYMPPTNEVLVIDGEKPSPVLAAATLKVKRTYNLPKGADSVAYD